MDSTTQYARELGRLIRSERRKRGLTQATLAERIHVTLPTLRKLESGDPTVVLQTALASLVELGVAQKALRLKLPERAPKPLPQIAPDQRSNFRKRLVASGIDERDAENTAWILSLTPEQRFNLILKQEREQQLCGIALR